MPNRTSEIVQHTPGPWTVSDEIDRIYNGNVIRYDTGERNGVVAIACDFNRFDRDAEREANARLIAAAPELLEAIRAANVQRDPRHRISMLVNDWQRIEAAVAKATGTEP